MISGNRLQSLSGENTHYLCPMRILLAVLLFYLPAALAAQQGLPEASPRRVGMNANRLSRIDTICEQAIAAQATPGCVVLVAKDGRIAYQKAFGYQTYDRTDPVDSGTIYDLASCTKICATTMAVMKLYEQGKLNLYKTLGDYLPWVRGSDKAPLRIRDVLLHQAGLKSFIPFFKETIDTT